MASQPQPKIRAKPDRWDWFEADVDVAKAIAQAPGVRYVSQGGRAFFELHRTHLGILRSASSEVRTLLVDLSKPLRVDEARSEIASARGLKLRATQQSGLDFIEPRRGVLVADEPRLGKTLTALMAHDPSKGPLVVVAPLSTRAVWLHWMKVLWPDVEPVVMKSRTMDIDSLKSAPIVFGHYDILRHHSVSSLRPGTFIVDEAHALSDSKSKRSEAVLSYATAAYRVLLLTGTPLWNTSRGLWTLLAACNPGAWGREFEFAQRYCAPTMTEYGWRYDGVSNEEEWLGRRSELLLLRRWEDVRSDLPPVTRSLELVDVDPTDLYQLDLLAVQLRQRDQLLTIENLNYYRQATGMFKVPLGADLAMRTLKAERDVVVWAWHRKVASALAKRIEKKGLPVYLLDGSDSEPARLRVLEAWKASPVPAALVATMAVAREGIDLSRAHHAIFVEVDWTPAMMYQAAMRTYDPTRPMSLVFIALDHDIDRALVVGAQGKINTGNAIGMPAAGSVFAIPGEQGELQSDDDLLMALAEVLARSDQGGNVTFA